MLSVVVSVEGVGQHDDAGGGSKRDGEKESLRQWKKGGNMQRFIYAS